jgi:hypothetical protein
MKQQEENQKLMELIEKECEHIAKFLKERVKLRPTLLMITDQILNGKMVNQDLSVDYCLGKDIHFTVLMHAKELLGMSKSIQKMQNLNGLVKIEDSVVLLSVLLRFNKFTFVIPFRTMYPNPKAPDAKRPKRVEIPPKEYQMV